VEPDGREPSHCSSLTPRLDKKCESGTLYHEGYCGRGTHSFIVEFRAAQLMKKGGNATPAATKTRICQSRVE
jgi:hypothetical protein